MLSTVFILINYFLWNSEYNYCSSKELTKIGHIITHVNLSTFGVEDGSRLCPESIHTKYLNLIWKWLSLQEEGGG